MALIQTITDDYHFWTWLKQSSGYSNNFSLQGAKDLQTYLEEMSDELGENIEFDPIAWCCEYSEYDNIKDYNKQHDTEFADWDELSDETTVIQLDNGGAVVQDY